MKKILKIDSSITVENSISRKLTNAIVAQLRQQYSESIVTEKDLALESFPHLSSKTSERFGVVTNDYTSEDSNIMKISNLAVEQLFATDFIVIGAGMYNFRVPSTLKAWIDHVARAGLTFRYTANGPEGLVVGKKVYLAISTRGVYSEGAYQPYDFVEPYLRAALGFLGMTDITTVRAEGLTIVGMKEKALDNAIASISI